ncbi:sce7726 family protein [Vibrio splendidus]|uniref:sce7726 family protein n=1 Tax=Vibrio splendidus TaxID=29497 RepID=UPI00030FF7EB|nr:sce7726 family protein [Vibrio splendidus]
MSEVLNGNEAEFKVMLIDYFLNRNSDVKLATEFPFNYLKRRADLIVIEDKSQTTHAIEIKSDIDNTLSLKEQLSDYRKTFNKASVLLSEKHLGIAKELDKTIGLYVMSNGQIVCRRKPLERKQLDKKTALDLVPTNELKRLVSKSSSLSRVELISKLSETLSFKMVNQLAFESVKDKVEPIYSLFLNEHVGVTTIHDLSILGIRHSKVSGS